MRKLTCSDLTHASDKKSIKALVIQFRGVNRFEKFSRLLRSSVWEAHEGLKTQNH